MLVVLVLAGLVVLGAVVVLAMGRGGELAAAPSDRPPLPAPDDRPFTGPAPFRIPRAIWGYQADVTEQMLDRLRYAVYERDTRIATLEHQIADLRRHLEPWDGPEDEPADEPAQPAPPAPPWESADDPVDLDKDPDAAADPREARP
ncbi:hypothetical protein ACFY4C_29840 [Actinomadura viridis]|uniref:hypothetical protein n=1 Tax=Actinomadura viridis TaxID=58110 RepID=UPI0036931A4E